jgi:hypothetical protein
VNVAGQRILEDRAQQVKVLVAQDGLRKIS